MYNPENPLILKILVLTFFLIQTSFAAQLTITLKAKAEVDPGVVLLKQVAEIKGDLDIVKNVSELEVGKVSEPGRRTRVTEKALKGFFIKSVTGSDAAVFDGAKFCEVVARAGLIPADSLKGLLLREVRVRMSANLQEGKDWTFETKKIPNAISAPKYGGKVIVNLSPQFSGIGQEMAVVQIFNGDKVIAKHSIPFIVHRFEYVAELKNGIRNGETISENDFRMVWQETTFQKRKVIKQAEEAIGRTAIRTLKAGELLVDNALSAPYAVKNGDVVRIFAKFGEAVVQTSAVAQKSAFKGQTISLKNADTGKDILATVSGHGEAWVN